MLVVLVVSAYAMQRGMFGDAARDSVSQPLRDGESAANEAEIASLVGPPSESDSNQCALLVHSSA